MNKKLERDAFFIVLVILVLIVTGHNYVRYYVIKDYPIQAFTKCDPAKYSCFVADQDTADPTFQVGPYSKVEMEATHAPACLDEHSCSEFTCNGEAGCTVTYCSDGSKEEGESCLTEKQ